MEGLRIHNKEVEDVSTSERECWKTDAIMSLPSTGTAVVVCSSSHVKIAMGYSSLFRLNISNAQSNSSPVPLCSIGPLGRVESGKVSSSRFLEQHPSFIHEQFKVVAQWKRMIFDSASHISISD